MSALSPMLLEYLCFISSSLRENYGIEVSAETLHADGIAHLDRIVPPKGRTFVAEVDNAGIVGMVFLRPCGTDALEIKRLYVLPQARGSGAGRALVVAAVAAARQMGATAIFLDSTKNLHDAARLYEQHGFEYIAPYPQSDLVRDPSLLPHAIFMRLDIRAH